MTARRHFVFVRLAVSARVSDVVSRIRSSAAGLSTRSLPASRRCYRLAALHLALVALLTTAAGPVQAGSLKNDVYTSGHGFSITLPSDWKAVDRGNFAVIKEEIPGPLAKKTSTETFDVMLFDGKLDPPEEGQPAAIMDNIMVVVVEPSIEAKADAANGLAAAVKAELAKMFAEVELVSGAPAKHAGVDTVDFQWKVAGADGALKGTIWQTVIPANHMTLLVTCSIAEDRVEERKELCSTAFDSIKLP